MAEEKIAAEVGRDILESGGNAFDAAVGVGFALAVTHPEAGNVGGGGYMVAHLATGENVALDFRETAPGKSRRDLYLKKDGSVDRVKILYGALAAGVPGTVDGLLHIHKKYGKLELKSILQPAIELAEKGIIISKPFSNRLEKHDSLFCRYESTKKIFTKNGKPFLPGDTLKQPDLANTLKLIAEKGRDGFYSGRVADAIINTMQKYNGIISHDDFKNYQSKERTPFVINFNDYTVISMPPSSSGGIIISQTLNMLENLNFKNDEYAALKYNHYLAESFKRCYADRAEYLGDPDFVDMPLNTFISKDYAKKRFKEIDPEKTS
ncbi:MAG: gamma-glutamyltransferase, partial [Calditrichia bacterium]|nr:gamma-glutamyltransferase [Calditrichia bacterium]